VFGKPGFCRAGIAADGVGIISDVLTNMLRFLFQPREEFLMFWSNHRSTPYATRSFWADFGRRAAAAGYAPSTVHNERLYAESERWLPGSGKLTAGESHSIGNGRICKPLVSGVSAHAMCRRPQVPSATRQAQGVCRIRAPRYADSPGSEACDCANCDEVPRPSGRRPRSYPARRYAAIDAPQRDDHDRPRRRREYRCGS